MNDDFTWASTAVQKSFSRSYSPIFDVSHLTTLTFLETGEWTLTNWFRISTGAVIPFYGVLVSKSRTDLVCYASAKSWVVSWPSVDWVMSLADVGSMYSVSRPNWASEIGAPCLGSLCAGVCWMDALIYSAPSSKDCSYTGL